MKKLHARGAGPFKIIKRIGPNAYVLDLPSDFGISSTFNISDLVGYKKPTMIPSEFLEPDPSLESEPTPECPPATLPKRGERIERVIDDKIVTTRNKDYQRYLVHWQGRPDSEDSWITQEELQRINPDLLEYYQSLNNPYSSGSSSFHPGRINEDIGKRKKLQTNDLWL